MKPPKRSRNSRVGGRPVCRDRALSALANGCNQPNGRGRLVKLCRGSKGVWFSRGARKGTWRQTVSDWCRGGSRPQPDGGARSRDFPGVRREAAAAFGISIPTLCYLKGVRPAGACRICVVEVEGVHGVQMAEVQVDTQSGDVTVLRMTAVEDPGAIINPQAVEGQIEGGVDMGIGMALREIYVHGQTTDWKTFKFPTIQTMPKIRIKTLETPRKRGPLGAAGVGEFQGRGNK